MKVKMILKWFDFWVGFYWDSKKKSLYFFPVPCIGFVFKFGKEIPPTPIYERLEAIGEMDFQVVLHKHVDEHNGNKVTWMYSARINPNSYTSSWHDHDLEQLATFIEYEKQAHPQRQ